MMPNEYPTRLDICDGKYTLIIDMDTGRAECLRYGEKWRDLIGDKMVLALFDELVEARAKAEVARAEVEALRAKIEAMEQQKPVAWMDRHGTLYNSVSHVRPSDKPLYALPGAKGEKDV